MEELIDHRLEKNYNEVEMLRMIEAAAACVRHSASRRPRMSQVRSFIRLNSQVSLLFPPKSPFYFPKVPSILIEPVNTVEAPIEVHVCIWIIFAVELYIITS